MLAKYQFVTPHKVNELQDCLVVFMTNIKRASRNDSFNADTYCPKDLADRVKSSKTLLKKITIFFNAYKWLGGQKRKEVDDAFERMNDIKALFEFTKTRVTIDDLPASIRTSAKNLFIYLYEHTLAPFGNIKDHYEQFYKDQKGNSCRFCGMERLEHFLHIKEDYDHLLAKTIYPFAAVNLKNLCPMCKKCNRTHKKTEDLILLNKKQCKAVNPYYREEQVYVHFTGSTLPTSSSDKGVWNVTFTPASDEVKRWNEVFMMSDRVEKDILTGTQEPEFRVWIQEFVEQRAYDSALFPLTNDKIKNALKEYGTRIKDYRYREKRYIKADLFKWMGDHASDRFIESLKSMLMAINSPTPIITP